MCVKDPSVSQKHAELVWTGAAWELTDLGSSNGTFVNGKELQEGGACSGSRAMFARCGLTSRLARSCCGAARRR